MLSWALAFFIVAVICATFGFTGILVGSVAEMAKVFFVVFVVLFLVALVAGLLRKP